MYVCMYVCVYVCVYICMYIYIYAHMQCNAMKQNAINWCLILSYGVLSYECMHMYAYVWICMDKNVWMCMNMYGKSEYVWICWICMLIYQYSWICMYQYEYVWICTNVYICVWMCRNMLKHVEICRKHAFRIVCIYIYININMHVCKCLSSLPLGFGNARVWTDAGCGSSHQWHENPISQNRKATGNLGTKSNSYR